MNKWIVCTTAHEAFEFDSEAEALAFKDKTEGAFNIYEITTGNPVSQFELWWISQDKLKTNEERFAAELGWTHAFKHTLDRMINEDQGTVEYQAWPFKYRSFEPFYVGHNAAVELLAEMLNDGDYPGYQ